LSADSGTVVPGGDPGIGAVTGDAASDRGPHHFRRLIGIWVVLCAVADPCFYFFVGPHIPPGDMTSSASGQQFDFTVLFVVALPVVLAVWVYMAYALIMWRSSRPGAPEPVGGAKARGHLGLQVGWITTTSVIVAFVFAFGLVELVGKAGAGGGQGPHPSWKPAANQILPVQVIAQQWKFTYRYPTFGGMETEQLVIPDDTTIAFHVTSLDVIHDFWAYQLGVKADANPGLDNVAYTTTKQLGGFTVRCAELCGLWHGAMYNYGKVVTQAQFMTWGKATEAKLADNTKFLPAFAWTYTPDANGATGGYYPTKDPYSPVEKYGATPAKVGS
jgi:cytochrome c oxidase subunit II